LREKLDKKDLRLLLQAIKGYRDDETADLLFETLKTYMVILSQFFLYLLPSNTTFHGYGQAKLMVVWFQDQANFDTSSVAAINYVNFKSESLWII